MATTTVLVETPLEKVTVQPKPTIVNLTQEIADCTETVPHNDIEPPPDGGLVAWLQVVAGHLVVFNTWGYIISFGIFQPYYVKTLSVDPSAVSWVGSIQACLVFLVSIFSGRAFDAGYYKTMLIVGSLMQLIGISMTSVASTYWQLFLAQGLCQGLGCGIVFAPTIANVSTYFTKKKTLAVSLVTCGASVGGLIYPLIAQQLMPRVGFGWTVRALGLIVLVSSIIVISLVKTRLPPRKSGALVELKAFKETSYLLFAIGMFFTLWATYFAYYYARAYAIDSLGGTQSTSFTILMIINGVGVPGRLLPAYLADRYFGAVNTLIPTVLSVAICIFSWAAVKSIAGDYVWVVFFGFFCAGIQSMFPATLAGLSKDLSKSGTLIGMIFTIVSISALTGPPMAGKLIEVENGSFLVAQMWGGACMIVGVILLTWAKVQRDKSKEEPQNRA